MENPKGPGERLFAPLEFERDCFMLLEKLHMDVQWDRVGRYKSVRVRIMGQPWKQNWQRYFNFKVAIVTCAANYQIGA